MDVRTKIAKNNNIIEKIDSFNYLGTIFTVTNSRDLEIKMNRFKQMFRTVRRTLHNETRKDTQMKSYKAMAVPTFAYGPEVWTATKQMMQTLKRQK
jgi:hypothetical protein